MIIMGMQIDFALQGHRFMKKRELATLLKGAGMKELEFKQLGGSVYLAIARK